MIRQSLILFFIAFELLFLSSSYGTIDFFYRVIGEFVFSLKHAEIGMMANNLRIDRICMAFAKRQIVDSIQ